MRKRQVSPVPSSVPPSGQVWLDVDGVELIIVPDKSGGLARASLASLRLA
jgi:hypothetical protein